MKPRFMLSGLQVVSLSSSSFLPLTFWFFPRTAVEYAGIDAQWAVLGIALIGLSNGFVLSLLNEQFPDMTIEDMFAAVWGRFVGKLFAIAIWPGYVFFVAISVYLFVRVLSPYFSQTPMFAMTIVTCLVALYGSYKGIETLGRVAAMTHVLSWIGVMLTAVFIIAQRIRSGNIVSLTYKIADWRETIHGVYRLLPLYLGFNLTTMLSPHYRHRPKRTMWYPVIAALLGGSLAVTVYLAVMITLGWEATKQIAFPVSFTIATLRLRGFIIERTGISVIILATMFTILFVSSHTWGLSELTARIFNRKPHQCRPFTFLIAGITMVLALVFPNEQVAFDMLNRYLVPFSWFALTSITITLVFAKLRGVQGRSRSPAETL